MWKINSEGSSQPCDSSQNLEIKLGPTRFSHKDSDGRMTFIEFRFFGTDEKSWRFQNFKFEYILKSAWKEDVDNSIFADSFWVIEIEISIAAPEAHGLQHDAYVMDLQSFRSNEDGKTPQNWCSEKKTAFRLSYCWWFRNPAIKPVEVGSFSFIICIFFLKIPPQVVQDCGKPSTVLNPGPF